MAKRKQSATVETKFRMKEPLRAALEKAAKKRGVSMNAEMAQRLELSFHDDSLLIEVLGGMFSKPLAMTLIAIGKAMTEAGMTAGIRDNQTWDEVDNWFDSPISYEKACEAASHILDRLRPAGEPEWNDEDSEYPEMYEDIGIKNASRVILALTENLPKQKKIPVQARGYRSKLDAWAEDYKAVLGPLCDRDGRLWTPDGRPVNEIKGGSK